ncbi:hypothetical protein GJ496_003856 [Pomphorhynchus laevis]|nr:hypothetical protein GJ496_003856 [Pomphorhynchus laevis]
MNEYVILRRQFCKLAFLDKAKKALWELENRSLHTSSRIPLRKWQDHFKNILNSGLNINVIDGFTNTLETSIATIDQSNSIFLSAEISVCLTRMKLN